MTTSRRRAAWLAGALWVVLALPLAAGPPSAPNASAVVSPASATLVVNRGSLAFSPKEVTLGGGGTLTLVNLDSFDHTVTSVATATDGTPLFDVRVPAGTSATITGVEALAEGSYAFYCKLHPQMRGVLVVEGGGGSVTPQLPSFDQPLVVPRKKRGTEITIPMRLARVRVLPTGPATRMWTYGGTYPGPTIVRPAGGETRVRFVHRLPRRAGALTVHLHGDHHASEHDGQPTTQLVRPGRARTYEYPLTYGGLPEPSSFFFYHDHRMNRTARNNWRGLQGMFVVKDSSQASLRLPTGLRDVPLMLADRSFRTDNELTNPFAHGPRMVGHHGAMAWLGPRAPPDDATVGTHVLVNGRYAPYLRVSATRYRLRLLNASHFSSYAIGLSDGRPLLQIGTGNGLLHKPAVRQRVLLGPAQRADVIVDFHGANGKNLVLDSVPAATGETGADARQVALMQFRVGAEAPDRSRLPARLPSPDLVRVPAKVSKTWTFDLGGSHRHGTFWSINGQAFDPGRVDHRARLGTVERWRLRNTSDMTHSVHIHAEQWRTVLRDGRRPPPWERGLEDTWRLEPGEVVEVATRFEDYTGPFMIHCHMLDHEDHGMMARFDVVD
ncbi:multicopper oxidase domain-containing protein [Nocardioides sp. InS609-2]|uniref:multicopper oxidase domain-containing protein n=1 Tax=Nocardioides sp. InS609-2 TaxID=2760705 RepID=UPI0020BF4496|nr:multicopper oxidase domain-containing protein [Nocardioides sp. InS609-2]